MILRREFLLAATVGCTTVGWERMAVARQPTLGPSGCSYRVKVGQGRQLGVIEYGDPHGFPVFYFHGLPVCRYEASILSDHASRSHCRLIAVDRPGIGLSSPQAGRTFLDWADDVSNLASSVIEEKDFKKSFSILGYSSGGPYAVACAHRLRSAGLTRVAVVSGVKLRSPAFSQVPDGMGGRLIALRRKHPRLARMMVNRFANLCRRRPNVAIRKMTKRMARADQRLFSNCVYRAAFLRGVHESMRQGPDGILEEGLLLGSCWKIPLCEITLPMSIWHGACDKTIPVAVGHKLAEQIPQSQLTVAANEGHVSLLRTFGYEILSWLNSSMFDVVTNALKSASSSSTS
jgi:pimeloyl-ACP methyl ester carboxylesterase